MRTQHDAAAWAAGALRFRAAQEWRPWCVTCGRRRQEPLRKYCALCTMRRLRKNARDRLAYARRRALAGQAPRVRRSPEYWRAYHRRYRLEHLERRRQQQRAYRRRREERRDTMRCTPDTEETLCTVQ